MLISLPAPCGLEYSVDWIHKSAQLWNQFELKFGFQVAGFQWLESKKNPVQFVLLEPLHVLVQFATMRVEAQRKWLSSAPLLPLARYDLSLSLDLSISRSLTEIQTLGIRGRNAKCRSVPCKATRLQASCAEWSFEVTEHILGIHMVSFICWIVQKRCALLHLVGFTD